MHNPEVLFHWAAYWRDKDQVRVSCPETVVYEQRQQWLDGAKSELVNWFDIVWTSPAMPIPHLVIGGIVECREVVARYSATNKPVSWALAIKHEGGQLIRLCINPEASARMKFGKEFIRHYMPSDANSSELRQLAFPGATIPRVLHQAFDDSPEVAANQFDYNSHPVTRRTRAGLAPLHYAGEHPAEPSPMALAAGAALFPWFSLTYSGFTEATE